MGWEVEAFLRLEDAAARLAERVEAARRERGPLAPVPVWAPSRSVGAFLKVELARRLGVAAHVETTTIARGLEAIGGGLLAHDTSSLRGRVLALLHDEALLASEPFAALGAWLEGAAGDARERRRSELAAELARSFERALVSRPRWTAARLAAPTDWRTALLARAISGSPRLTLEALARGIEAPPPELHVVGHSILRAGELAALRALAERAFVRIYAPNPSRDLWADPTVPLEELIDSCLLLSRAGPALRETMFQAGTGEGDLPVTPEGATLLSHLQACLEAGRDAAFGGAMDDGTLEVWASPGIRREVEAVAQEIWRRMAADPALRFEDFAIYYVDREEQPYAPHLASVLEEAHRIPHKIAHTPLSRESPVVGVAKRLLALPLSGRTRPEVLGLLCEPLVSGAFGDADPAEWREWCDDVGVLRGASAEDLAGSYVEGRPLYHWEQGLARVALGALMDEEPFGSLRPRPLSSSRLRAAGRLVLLARSLLATAAELERARRPVGAWLHLLGGWLGAVLSPRQEGDARALRACIAAIARMAAVDAGLVPVSYRIAHDLAVEALDGISAPSGAELVGRVHVAPLAMGAVVPAPHVFVIGLGGTAFPSRASPGELDLVSRAEVGERADDVAEARLAASAEDRDRAAFLEVLRAARARLVLSWEARDALTGDPRTPSSLISDVIRWAEKVGAKPFVPKAPPLSRHELDASDGAGVLALPAVAREARAASLGRGLPSSLLPVRLRVEPLPEVERALGLVPLGRAAPIEADRPARVVSLSQLRKYLGCPLQGSASYLLGLADDEADDELSLAEEPFASPVQERGQRLRKTFHRALGEGPDLDAALARFPELHRRSWEAWEAAARAPAAGLGEAERRREQRAVEVWAAELKKAFPAIVGAPLLVRAFGRPSELDHPAELRPAIRLETAHGPVELVGDTEPFAAGEARLGVYLTFPRNKARAEDRLRAYLAQLALTLTTGVEAPLELLEVCVAGDLSVKSQRHKLQAISLPRARSCLTNIVEDLLAGPFEQLFPYPAAQQVYRGQPVERAVDRAKAELEKPFGKPSWSYGPVRDLEDRHAPSAEVAKSIVTRRYAPLFELDGDRSTKR